MSACRGADTGPCTAPIICTGKDIAVTVHASAYDTAQPGDVSDFSRKLRQFDPTRIVRNDA